MLDILKKALFSIILVFLLAVGVEILLGVVYFVKDWHIEPMEVKDYPYLYYLFRNNEAELNRDGFKTTASREKDEHKVRIMLTGGSVARGREPSKSIAAFMEKELEERLNTDRIEVINAGVSAFVLQQEFILTQTVLQHYKPEVIIGLDGYNDMLTFKFNRFHESDFALPPHNWQDFRVIEENRYDKTFASRFTHFFRYITRAVHFVERQYKEQYFSWQDVSERELDSTALAYSQILDDLHNFCLAKGIIYRNFFQPIRYYPPETAKTPLTAEEKTLAKLYRKMEEVTKDKVYGYSLAGMFEEQKGLYRDNCHLSAEGHKQIANRIVDRIETDMRELMLMKPKEFMDIKIN